jgi:hypothetical protein
MPQLIAVTDNLNREKGLYSVAVRLHFPQRNKADNAIAQAIKILPNGCRPWSASIAHMFVHGSPSNTIIISVWIWRRRMLWKGSWVIVDDVISRTPTSWGN